MKINNRNTPPKAVPIFVVAMICLSLAACGAKTQTGSLGIVSNKEVGAKISLGMTRDKVEAVLNPEGKESVEKPQEPCVVWSATYGKEEDQITVMYNGDTDVVEHIMVGDDEDKNKGTHWVVDGQISLGSSKAEIEQVYGVSRVREEIKEENFISYNYDTNGEQTDGTNTDVILGFRLDDADQTNYITISKVNK